MGKKVKKRKKEDQPVAEKHPPSSWRTPTPPPARVLSSRLASPPPSHRRPLRESSQQQPGRYDVSLCFLCSKEPVSNQMTRFSSIALAERGRLRSIIKCLLGCGVPDAARLHKTCLTALTGTSGVLALVDRYEEKTNAIVPGLQYAQSNPRPSTKQPWVEVCPKNTLLATSSSFNVAAPWASFVLALGTKGPPDQLAAALYDVFVASPVIQQMCVRLVCRLVRSEIVNMCSDKKRSGFRTLPAKKILDQGCEKLFEKMYDDLRDISPTLRAVLLAGRKAGPGDLRSNDDFALLASAAPIFKQRAQRICLYQTIFGLLLRGERLTKEGLLRLQDFCTTNAYSSLLKTAKGLSIDPVALFKPWKCSIEKSLKLNVLRMADSVPAVPPFLPFTSFHSQLS
jgi:hypothetical protein